MKIYLYAVIALICSTSCEKKFTRNQAKEKINDFYMHTSEGGHYCWITLPTKLPTQTEHTGWCVCMTTDDSYISPEIQKAVNQYIQAGYLKIDTVISYSDDYCCTYYKYFIKPKDQYAIYQLPAQKNVWLDEYKNQQRFKLIETEVDQVTGIVEEGNMATVDYTRKVKGGKTPFGSIYSTEDCGCIRSSYTATFQKYDDGWRMIK